MAGSKGFSVSQSVEGDHTGAATLCDVGVPGSAAAASVCRFAIDRGHSSTLCSASPQYAQRLWSRLYFFCAAFRGACLREARFSMREELIAPEVMRSEVGGGVESSSCVVFDIGKLMSLGDVGERGKKIRCEGEWRRRPGEDNFGKM